MSQSEKLARYIDTPVSTDECLSNPELDRLRLATCERDLKSVGVRCETLGRELERQLDRRTYGDTFLAADRVSPAEHLRRAHAILASEGDGIDMHEFEAVVALVRNALEILESPLAVRLPESIEDAMQFVFDAEVQYFESLDETLMLRAVKADAQTLRDDEWARAVDRLVEFQGYTKSKAEKCVRSDDAYRALDDAFDRATRRLEAADTLLTKRRNRLTTARNMEEIMSGRPLTPHTATIGDNGR